MLVIKNGGMPIICQLFSFIPDELIKKATDKFEGDKRYKTLKTKTLMIFGIIGKVESLNGILKSLVLFGNSYFCWHQPRYFELVIQSIHFQFVM